MFVESAVSDDGRAADLTWELQQWLRDADLDPVVATGQPTEDAKGAALDWANLVVTATGGLPFLIQIIRGWVSRSRGTRVTISLDGDTLTLEGTDEETQRRLVDTFLARHGHK